MTLLKLLKQRGKALVIQGPQGCGKTLLAKQLAEAEGEFAIIEEHQLTGRFTGWLKNDVVIVEDFSDRDSIFEALEPIISLDTIACNQVGRDVEQVETPQLILCINDYETLQENRRFFVMQMGAIL